MIVNANTATPGANPTAPNDLQTLPLADVEEKLGSE